MKFYIYESIVCLLTQQKRTDIVFQLETFSESPLFYIFHLYIYLRIHMHIDSYDKKT